jgi:putative tryptophan/tyrosine transport system substrate-binding protein
MRRREFIALVGGAAVAWPLPASGQQPTMPVIGFLSSASPDSFAHLPYVRAFLQGLNETGYVDGRNVVIEYRWAEGRNERLSALAADLVGRRVSVISATNTPAVLAAKAATTTTPIVFVTAADPVELGLVASLSRPGGMITGVTFLSVEVLPKRLELLRELMPTATTVGALINPTNSAFAETLTRDLQATARTLGLQPLVSSQRN